MPSTRNIRRRIRSVKNTAQITKAMQTVAASKMRKAQDAAVNGRPFADRAIRILANAARSLEDYEHPLLEEREVRRRAVILITTDKGLCGGLNAYLMREAAKYDRESTVFIAAGRKGAQFLARTRRNLAAEFSFADVPTFSDAMTIANAAKRIFTEREVDRVEVLYPKFINTLTQQPKAQVLLPMECLWEEGGAGQDGEKGGNPTEVDYLFEPGASEVMNGLLRWFLDFQILQLMLETKASEHSARMVAMKNATENADQLIKDLTLTYNKIRQAGITTELLDISVAQLAIS
ncbi:MAG: ATP synthase F1 subunit gamma [Verrucomicrobiae bacterium]|nr:ATP synthase F1 subunit gamma [Verrucomicrobiae bacterium]MCP5523847.1 ATP synthase F1 subunit gamma [Verrucomicrobiales bacterium]